MFVSVTASPSRWVTVRKPCLLRASTSNDAEYLVSDSICSAMSFWQMGQQSCVGMIARYITFRISI